MKIIIFGTGKIYQLYKNRLDKSISVIALLDNHPQAQVIDNIQVYYPEQVNALKYDYILLLSIYETEMKNQLLGLGVNEQKICGLEQLEAFLLHKPLTQYGEWSEHDNGDGKRIVFFSPGLTSSGAERMLYLTVKMLKNEGHTPVVISKLDGILGEELESINVLTLVIENWDLGNEYIREVVAWADLIFVNTLQLYYQVYRLLDTGKQILWWLHEYTGLENIKKAELETILERTDVKIYAVSERVRSEIMRRGRYDSERIGILPIGVENMDKKLEVRKRDREQTVFAVIAAISEIKGQDVYIKAVNRLPEDYKRKAQFWIVGAGLLKNIGIEDTEIDSSIKVMGEFPHAEMTEVYNSIDVVVCASRCEGMSATALEGFSCGKPLITSNAAGIAEFITNGVQGLIFLNENEEDLQKKLMWMIDNKDEIRMMGQQGKQLYERYFSEEAFRGRMSETIEKILE